MTADWTGSYRFRRAARRCVRPLLRAGAGLTALATTAVVAAGGQQPSADPRALVFNGVTVVDVERGTLVPAQRVVVAGNRIRAVGRAGTVKLPNGAQVVDARGQYLIPGLWDLHVHLPSREHGLLEPVYPLFVANGVTGFRDAGTGLPLDTLVQWRREILAGTRVGPPRQLLLGSERFRGISAGSRVATFEDLVRTMDSLKRHGADFLKVYPYTDTIAAAARRVGLPFGGHVQDDRKPGDTTLALTASDRGIRIIDHVSLPSGGGLEQLCWGVRIDVERCRRASERLRQNGTWVTLTLIKVADGHQNPIFVAPSYGPSFPLYWYLKRMTSRFWADSAFPHDWLRDWQRKLTREDADSTVGWPGRLAVAEQAGLPIVAATDFGRDQGKVTLGLALHAELAAMVAEGLTPLTALRSATLNPAKLLGATDSLGTVVAGKLADLVLLDANPLDDITNTTAIRAVVANGRYYDRAALDRLLAEARGHMKEAARRFKTTP